MKLAQIRSSADPLSVVTLFCTAALIAILWRVAVTTPSVSQTLIAVIVGLGAGGLILFRQNRKTLNKILTGQARAHYMATHDELTQLPNKALLLDRLRTALAGSQVKRDGVNAGLLCIGLDRFEEVGEALGHDAGDVILSEISTRLRAICRETDTLARLGDDSFAFLWDAADAKKAHALATGLIGLLSRPFDAAGGRALITCSVGFSFVDPRCDSAADVLRQAQLALSSAKRLGGAQFCTFDATMDATLKGRKSLEVDLKQALANGDLKMVYQPQVNQKGVMFGVEALMRWTSASRGEVPPSEFIPLSESCGLSEELGRFALEQSLLDSKRWPGLKVAVNVSALQVRGGNLVTTLKTLLQQTGANPKNFELEITEGVLLSHDREVEETLGAIRGLGFTLALDDFGTGYSSLSYLRQFPIDKIKIDRAFIAHLGMRPESDAIVKAIVDLAGALDLKVIAEGVETKAQVERLGLAGCSQIQGYYYSRPVGADVIDELVSGRAKLAA